VKEGRKEGKKGLAGREEGRKGIERREGKNRGEARKEGLKGKDETKGEYNHMK
jgi:hypothetical protein